MSFDYGTNKLGIQNPFKPEGLARTITGALITLFAIYVLIGVSAAIKQDLVKAWMDVILGFGFLIWGLRKVANGSLQLFRYYVGRAVPTSLAPNRNPSEKDNAKHEAPYYRPDKLESMLMGRKNTTFTEPDGWVARLVNTLLPNLLITPYPIRNFVQQIGSMLATTVVAFVAFGLAYFVSVSGLIGKAGQLITPVLSFILLVYLLAVWLRVARAIRHRTGQEKHKTSKDRGVRDIAWTILLAIGVPIVISFFYAKLNPQTRHTLQLLHDSSAGFSAWFNLTLLIVLSAICIGSVWLMIRERIAIADAPTEVSEFRGNLQESVHPREIFINIENIVLSNRRYKEIPNRVYTAFDPELEEQTPGKGSFKGKLLIETQPAYEPIEFSTLFQTGRLASTIAGQILFVVSAILLFFLDKHSYDFYHSVSQMSVAHRHSSEAITAMIAMASTWLKILFSFLTVQAAAMVLDNGTHLFWAEMHFSSLLMWMNTEGTFTESKISTGMSIHDSTRSENTVVRSSITPWIITSRIKTSTFATTGFRNLELPRIILQMNKNDEELGGIVDEIKTFLHDRETIASINNESDLINTSNIFQVNQQTRSHMTFPDNEQADKLKLEEEAASGHLRQHEPSDA